jgi:hypothetical protein
MYPARPGNLPHPVRLITRLLSHQSEDRPGSLTGTKAIISYNEILFSGTARSRSGPASEWRRRNVDSGGTFVCEIIRMTQISGRDALPLSQLRIPTTPNSITIGNIRECWKKRNLFLEYCSETCPIDKEKKPTDDLAIASPGWQLCRSNTRPYFFLNDHRFYEPHSKIFCKITPPVFERTIS